MLARMRMNARRRRFSAPLFSLLFLGSLAALAGAAPTAPQPRGLFPCKPCGGLRTDDPRALAAAWSADWKPGGEPHVVAAWRLPLDGSGDATPAQALRDAGLEPWLTLVFKTEPPLRDHLGALGKELEAEAELVRAAGAGSFVQIDWQPPGAIDPREYAFLFKRASVAATGALAGVHVVTLPLPTDLGFVRGFYGEDVAAYADVVALAPAPEDALAPLLTALAESDPGKPVVLDREPYPPAATPTLALATAAERAAAGLTAVLFELPPGAAPDLRPLKVLAAEFQGDVSYDPGSRPEGSVAWAFVRGKDLALRVVTRAAAPGSDVALRFPDSTLTRITRLDPASGREVGLGGRRAGNAIETTIPKALAADVLKIERSAPGDLEQVKEHVNVTGEKTIQVEEILRRLQAFEDAQARRLRQYEATNSTSLRFRVAAGVSSIEATFQGPYFVRQGEPPDWVWQDFFFNGVRWRGKSIPEIPLIQPQKAAAMPLEIHFTKEYHYTLRGTETAAGRACWVVDFAPVASVPQGSHLYRGTVWIDQQTSARVRTRGLQLGLQGEVISNEETLDYSPVDAAGGPATWEAEAFVLPLRVYGQQILSILNGTTLVEKETNLTDLRINPDSFEADRQKAFDSAATMVRDTSEGLRYLAKDADGKRVVREGFAKSKLFAVAGVFYEKSLDYPLPLAGVNYFSLDLKGTGKQFNVFFAGALTTVNLAQPRLRGSRFDLGGKAFAIAVPLDDKQYVDGKEVAGQTFKVLPANAGLTLGHPIGSFLKATFSYDSTYDHYQRTRDTAADFRLPVDHLTHSFSLDLKFARTGYQLTGGAGYSVRSRWQPWGLASNPDYSPAAKDYWRWEGTFSKTWDFQAFRRLGLELDYFGGRDLDRFSKYQFGFFGGARVHGYSSNKVRAEQVWAAHATYGFGIGDLFRIDATADAAWATDRLTGLRRELLGGVGLVGTLMGPWETVVNLDLGTPVAGPEHGVVVYVVFLKLFK